jgi:hypothetical protein
MLNLARVGISNEPALEEGDPPGPSQLKGSGHCFWRSQASDSEEPWVIGRACQWMRGIPAKSRLLA